LVPATSGAPGGDHRRDRGGVEEQMDVSRRFRCRAGAVAALVSLHLLGAVGAADAAGDRIRKITIVSAAQASDPQEFQAAQLIAQEWRKLGLEIEVKGMPRPQLSDLVWYNRDKWDATMWRMVGRPERSDPDELVYNLFHSANAAKGYNFVGYVNPDYDRIAEAQRRETDAEKRKSLVQKTQDLAAADAAYLFLVHPKNTTAFLNSALKSPTVVDQSGIGIRNFWTFIAAEPAGESKDMVLNASEAMNAINPLYISGAIDSWITELVWDRLMRVGPDGLPKPWAADSVTWVDDKTLEVVIRPGMTWHDGKPVTSDDVVFSFTAPQGDKAPMYKPFVADIAAVEKVGDSGVRFRLKQPNAAFLTTTLAKINLVPKHVWEPLLKELEGSAQTAEQKQEAKPVGSGPFRVVRYGLQEEVVLERNKDHWAAPRMDRLILRVVTNTDAALGMLRRGEINFLSDYRGDPKLLEEAAKQQKSIEVSSSVDMGFRFVGLNMRRPPFDDLRFRKALALAVNRNLMVAAAWNGYAVPSGSVIAPSLTFWHKPEPLKASLDEAKQLLKEAGYELVGGKLSYPEGKKEALGE
jgi:peptide/nickel transport system substrate-binding protein